VQGFATQGWASVPVEVDNATQRILHVAIPPNPTVAQVEQLNRAIEEAARIGVEIIIIIFR